MSEAPGGYVIPLCASLAQRRPPQVHDTGHVRLPSLRVVPVKQRAV